MEYNNNNYNIFDIINCIINLVFNLLCINDNNFEIIFLCIKIISIDKLKYWLFWYFMTKTEFVLLWKLSWIRKNVKSNVIKKN